MILKAPKKEKCKYCFELFKSNKQREKLSAHEKVCLLNPENLIKIINYIVQSIFKRSESLTIKLVPSENMLFHFCSKNQIEQWKEFKERCCNDLTDEQTIDFIFSIFINNGFDNDFKIIPPHIRYCFDAMQYLSEEEFNKKIEFVNQVEADIFEYTDPKHLKSVREKALQEFEGDKASWRKTWRNSTEL